eukprot:5775307-Amphidinium_carterae.1
MRQEAKIILQPPRGGGAQRKRIICLHIQCDLGAAHQERPSSTLFLSCLCSKSTTTKYLRNYLHFGHAAPKPLLLSRFCGLSLGITSFLEWVHAGNDCIRVRATTYL